MSKLLLFWTVARFDEIVTRLADNNHKIKSKSY